MSVDIVSIKGEHGFAMHCDFCAKPEVDALVLIASPNGAHICDECVDLCGEIVAEKRKEREEMK